MFFTQKSSTDKEGIQVLGFSIVPGASEPTECTRVIWSQRATDVFQAIAIAAARSGDAAGRRLPHATLRALLSASLPNPLFVSSDLSLPGPQTRESNRFAFAECDGTAEECLRAANFSVRSWVPSILAPWVEARGVPPELLSDLSDLARSGELVSTERKTVDLVAVAKAGASFPDVRDAIHAAAFRRLAGTEIFPGLGPVRALVRSRERDNAISFITFPRKVTDGAWSMRARLTVETLPGQDLPFARLEVSRVRWCGGIPKNVPARQRRISATVIGAEEKRAVSFDVPVYRGSVQNPEDPAYVLSALRSGIDPGEGFVSHVSAGPRDDTFVGIPHAPGYEPDPAVATGATELDWLDCHDAIAAAMAGILAPMAGTSIPASVRVDRDNEDIPAVKAVTILTDIAQALGHNDIDNNAIAEAWEVLHGGELPAGVKLPANAIKLTQRFDELRQANTDRVRKVFGSAVPSIIVLSASADEGAAIVEIVKTLFAGGIRVVNRLIPVGVHGARSELGAADGNARERYENRIGLWKPFAEQLNSEYGPARVLVHAKRFRDDTVNKIAGRVALARYGDCNVQYLDTRGRKADEWFFRIQAAVLDLMFGHSGLVSPVANDVAAAFPDPATRPRSIIGISVVSQNRTFARLAASFFLAVSIDVETGRTTATAARPKDGSLEYLGPFPFFDLLKAVSNWDGSNIGSTEAAKADFQEFVSDIVGEACLAGANPLVMIDGTHSKTLWPSISNKGLAERPTLTGRPFDPAVDWPGARLVRIQDTIEPNVVIRKSSTYASFDPATGEEGDEFVRSAPTLTKAARLVRLAGTASNYISSGELDGQQKIAKGLSVYRKQTYFKALKEKLEEYPKLTLCTELPRDLTEEPYKLPGTIGILVSHFLPGDDPDWIAALCHGLRSGFGHTRSPTRLPAPLFQTRKVAEYIPAYVLEEDGSDEGAPAEEISDDLSDEENGEEVDDAGQSVTASENPIVAPSDAAERSGLKARLLDNLADRRPVNSLLVVSGNAQLQLATPEWLGTGPITHRAASLPIPLSETNVTASTVIPADVKALASGDAALEELLEMYWVGPLPSFMTEAWILPFVVSQAAPRARQQIHEALAKGHAPMRPFLPDLDPKSDASFGRFMLALMCIADGVAFLLEAIPRQLGRNTGRWIFNGIFDQVFRHARTVRRTESPESVSDALNYAPLPLLRLIHTAGHEQLVRQWLALAALFNPSSAKLLCEASAKLRAEFGEQYAELVSFTGRIATYYARRSDVKKAAIDYLTRERSRLAPQKIGRAAMIDAEEVQSLPSAPETPAPGVDANWLRDKISLSGAFRSHLHAHRQLIRDALRDEKAWPDEKPSSEAITVCVARLFSVSVPALAVINQREKESLFRPFYRQIESTVRAIEETRPSEERVALHPSWASAGQSPLVFAYLVQNGYRKYASELALVRAVENPSLPLEEAAFAAGEEFSEIAGYIAARRRATLWFIANDERAESELFASYVSAFEEGELSASTKDEPATGVQIEEPQIVIEPADVVSNENSSVLTPVTDGGTLASILREIEAVAGVGVRAARQAEFDALDTCLDQLSSLVSDAREAALALPRMVINEVLLKSASALLQNANAIAERLGEALALPPLPPRGAIDPDAAEAAEQCLRSGESAAARTHEALTEVDELRARAARTEKLIESAAILASLPDRIGSVQAGFAEVIEAIHAIIPLLSPAAIAIEASQAVSTNPLSILASAGANQEPIVATSLHDGPSISASEEPTSGQEDAGEHASETSIAEITASPELVTDEAFASEPPDSNADDDLQDDEIAELQAAIETLDVSPVLPLAMEPVTRSEVPDEENLELLEYVDLDAERINEALGHLVAEGSYGLAHHLARASEIDAPERRLAITSDEAKLAALAGHLNHTALQSRLDLVDRWVQTAFRVVDLIAGDDNQDRGAARLMSLMPLMIELGIFFPSLGAAEFLRSFGSLPGELGTCAQKVFERVDRIQHTNVMFSRAMLANVANELDCSKALADTRNDLLRKAELFASMKFDFQLANKIRNELNKTDQPVGGLRAQLQKGVDDARTLEMVREFVDRFRDRGRIVQLFDDTEVALNFKYQGLDGVARNRLVAFFESFRDIANGYIELMAEVEQAQHAERPKVREYAKQIARSVDDMILAVDAAAGDLGHIGTTARHVGPRLRKVAGIISGEHGMSAAPSTDIYQACHAEMALILDLEFGRSWLPSPYDPAQVIEVLCEITAPILPAEPTSRDETFERIVRARMERGSYVGANMLLDAAPYFGIDENLTAFLTNEVEVSVADSKDVLRDDFEQARRLVERVIRFGSLRQGNDAEEATALLDRIEKLEAVEIPATVTAGDRTEEPSEGVYDVSVAIDELENIKSEAQKLLDEPRIRLERRIDELGGKGASRELLDRLRALCQSGDLLTAEEHIDEVAKTGQIFESRRRNHRFDAFSETVLPLLARHRHDLAQELAAALRDGQEFEGIPYAQLSDSRRAESAEIIDMWRDLFRRFHDTAFAAHFSSFLDKLGIDARIKHVSGPGSVQRKMFTGDFSAQIPIDQESLLLPDFGSRTEGVYRMVVAQSMPSDSVISEHCSVGKLGVILFVSDVVPPEQRKQFYMRNLAAHRRVLLVDSASLYFALGEPSIRALTLIELAQPYSYVEPYRDWGRDAVPPEMFVGREEDIARIADPEGSNIVYGGRRMGKTAILRHLVTVRHDPANGMLVAFVDAQDVGRGNTATKVVWSEIAAALPEIFGSSPPTEPKRVRDTIQRWIEEDGRRRVLLLLDECDHFVVSDASLLYPEFLQLQKLMTETKRRFKFVLAGLSDVTRLVQTGNPPLKQISANPRRIGSLTGQERKDAEDLVLRPFAALGLELERTDVWRILSHANYYPVLIQTYSQRLLQSVMDRIKATQKPMRKVPSDLVAEVMEDLATRSQIKNIFEFTLGIDLRYRLIAYVVANLVFQAEAEGRVDEGFPTHQIRENAINFWEAGFQDRNRFSLFDDLLDEMEGLGIVRRVGGDRWTLRSTAVVRLLGNRDEIESSILEFADRKAPIGFDPKSHRRILPAAKNVLSEKRSSPLTLGQERDIVLSKARATIIIGNRLADYTLVPWALKSVPDSFSDGDTFDVRLLPASSPAELDAAIREMKVATGKKTIAIVQAFAPWTAEWVRNAINAKPVSRGDIRLIFVGGPEHAASVVGDSQLGALTSHVAMVPLEPWSTAFFTDMVNKENVVSLSQRFDAMVSDNGGWSLPMWQLFAGGHRNSSRSQAEPIDAEDVGLRGRYGNALTMLARVHGPSPLSLTDVEEYIGLDEELSSLQVPAKAIVDYGMVMGILISSPGKASGERDRGRYVFSPLAARLLELAPAVAAE